MNTSTIDVVLNEQGKKIFALLPCFPSFTLAGGTALALHMGHRQSRDFDLFSAHQISKNLLKKVEETFVGFSVVPRVNNTDELTVFVDAVKVTFLFYPFPPLLPTDRLGDINIFSVKELAAMKAYTVGRRGVWRDYVDLYYALIENRTTIPELIDLARRKYGSVFSDRLFLEQLVYLDDVEKEDLVFLKPSVSKQTLQAFFERAVRQSVI